MEIVEFKKELKGDRIILRQHITDDDYCKEWVNLFKSNKEELIRWYDWVKYISDYKSIKETTLKYNNIEDQMHYGILLDDKLIGAFMIYDIDFSISKADIAFYLDKNYYGKGYATEALKTGENYLFNKAGFNKLCLKINIDNKDSEKLAKANNYFLEGILRQEDDVRDNLEDMYLYTKLKSEWDGRYMNKAIDAKQFLGKTLDVIMDRPLGSQHPKCGFEYEVNYGYIPEVFSADGDELDAYVLGVDKPIDKFTGVCIAVFERTDDNEDKLVIAPEGSVFTPEEIEKAVEFQEKWFKHKLFTVKF